MKPARGFESLLLRHLRKGDNSMDEKEKKIKFVAQEAKVSHEVARIALDYGRGSIRYALDFLTNQHCRTTFAREAREYGLV